MGDHALHRKPQGSIGSATASMAPVFMPSAQRPNCPSRKLVSTTRMSFILSGPEAKATLAAIGDYPEIDFFTIAAIRSTSFKLTPGSHGSSMRSAQTRSACGRPSQTH